MWFRTTKAIFLKDENKTRCLFHISLKRYHSLSVVKTITQYVKNLKTKEIISD